MYRSLLLTCLPILALTFGPGSIQAQTGQGDEPFEFVINPVVPQRADPWVYRHTDDFYYFTGSVPAYDRIELRRAESLQGLASVEPVTVWRKHESGPMSYHIWAPELHYIGGKWYIYFAAGRADAVFDIRMYVLENEATNPLEGTWVEKGQLKTNWESFSLDATSFEHRGKRYLVWAQNDPEIRGNTNLYIAEMENPWTIRGRQVMLTKPEFEWEIQGYLVNEGAAVLKRNGRIFIAYSGSATDARYAMGLLTADEDADLLNATSWTKSAEPVFVSSPENSVYGPGHNSFTTSKDGTTDVLVYHGRSYRDIMGNSLYDPNRQARMQVLRWNSDGTPRFDVPVPDGPHVITGTPPQRRRGNTVPSNSSFHPGERWNDTDGNVINAHGGGILFHEGFYYWFGEYRLGSETPRTERATPGVSCYSSTDLYNWKFEGLALETVDEPGHDIERGAIVERPKVVFNKETGRFVMWFHLELKGQGYGPARAGVAVADQVTGPYTFVTSKRAVAGRWPRDFPEDQRQSIAGEDSLEWWTPSWREAVERGLFVRRDFEGGQMSRDQTVFVDSDGTAYQIAAAEENLSLHIRELTPDYLDFTGDWIQIIPGGHNEAPAVFEYDGTYYLLASGATGWDPNAARSFRATSIWGPWESLGNPTVGVNPATGLGPEKTFGGQSTFILPVHGKPGAFIAMFDMWRPRNQVDSRYLWLPVQIENGRFTVRWMNEWDLSYFD